MKRIRFLFSGIFEINGHALPFAQGDIAEVEERDADRLIIGLCAVDAEHDTEHDTEHNTQSAPKKTKRKGETWQAEQ